MSVDPISGAMLAMGALGTVGNFVQGQQQSQAASTLAGAQANELNWMQQYQQQLAAMTPAQITQMLNQLTLPISSNMQSAVTAPVYAQLAQQGLGQAPGTALTEATQAMAPYQLQQQQLAEQLLGMKLSAPLAPGQQILQTSQNLPSYWPPQSNNMGWFQQYLNRQAQLQNQGPMGTGSPGAYPNPTFPSNTFNFPGGLDTLPPVTTAPWNPNMETNLFNGLDTSGGSLLPTSGGLFA